METLKKARKEKAIRKKLIKNNTQDKKVTLSQIEVMSLKQYPLIAKKKSDTKPKAQEKMFLRLLVRTVIRKDIILKTVLSQKTSCSLNNLCVAMTTSSNANIKFL